MDTLETWINKDGAEKSRDGEAPPHKEAKTTPNVISSFPLLCTALARDGGSETIPAVKYCFVDGGWAIFPLSRSELGSV